MDRREAMTHIRKAKAAHIRWRSYAQALVSGVAVSDEKIPVAHTDCAFGQWYHGPGKALLGHLDSYEGIYTPHEMLHAIYHRIFDTLKSADNSGRLKKLFSSKETQQHKRLELAREYMVELIGVSETLLQALEMLEEEVRETLPE
jgi:hypothetical protein